MSGQADLLFKRYYESPESAAEKEKKLEIGYCKGLVDESYEELEKAFKKNKTQAHFSRDVFYRPYFECARHVLKKDNIDLTVSEKLDDTNKPVFGRDRYDVKYNRKF